ncbi:MAG: hypothetical protein MZV70_30240 [Desulfobacterales bacterium]|nr:hypothetical protein [Desulfobacterales bacterium]
MVKNFSPDFTIYIYKKAFEDAGVAIPDILKSLSYAEVMNLAKKLVKKEGDRVLMFGYYYEAAWTDRIIMNMLAEKSSGSCILMASIKIILGNEEAKSAAKWFYDMANEKLTYSAINPSPAGWGSTDFTAGQLAMIQYGFWYSAMAGSDTNKAES